jgi:predicted Zn-dependent peptidase
MIINLKSQTDLSGFYVVFNGSTNIETRGQYGISHLMEHLICKNFESLRPEFEKWGIEWNAYTSQNEIVFLFTGLDRFLSTRKSKLLDYITQFNIDKSQFENERKIILQEYTNTFSDQSECHLLNLQRKLYKNYNSIGLREDLESLSFLDCLNFFERQYQTPTKIINVSKYNKFGSDIDFSDSLVNKRFEFGPYKDVILEPTRNFGEKVSIILLSKLVDQDFNYNTFITNMLSMGLSSPLSTEIREKRGLVYHIDCVHMRMNKQGMTEISTQTSLKNANQVIDVIETILKNPFKYLNKKRFEIIKNHYKVKYMKDQINRYQNVNQWINPRDWSVKEILPTITYEKVMDVFENNFKFEDFYQSIDKTEFT